MLYLCCTKLGITLVNPLFIGYCKAIYDKPVLAAAVLFVRSSSAQSSDTVCSMLFTLIAVKIRVCILLVIAIPNFFVFVRK